MLRAPRSIAWLLGAVVTTSALFGCARPKLQILGDTQKLELDEPLPRRSPLFDGTTLKLRGARGETLGFQVRFDEPAQAQLALELPVTAARVEGFKVRYVPVREPSTNLYGKSRGPGDYPDVLVPAGSRFTGEKQAFFDVSIDRAARPGRYRGSLRVQGRVIPAELIVEPITIDLQREPLVWVFYLPKEIARAHGLADDDSPALLDLERRYHALFRQHGTYLAATIRPERFEARREFVRGVQFWPVALDLTSEATITRDTRRWLDLFENSAVTPFAIPVDEPHTVAQKQRARWIADVMGRAGGKRPRLLRGVTDSAASDYGSTFDVYLSPLDIPNRANQRRASGERFWTYNGRPPRAGSLVIDADGAALRTWGWIAERYGVELWHAWEGVYFEDRYNRGGPTDLYRDPVSFDERSKGGSDYGNGDGVLAYPGPLPSLRLKALRRGLEDRLLIRRLAECGGRAEADAIVRRVVPRALGEAGSKPSWPTEEADWERARGEVLDSIVRRCRDAA